MNRNSFIRWIAFGLLGGIFYLAALQPVSMYGQDESGRKTKSKVTPIYPELAKRMNVFGSVKIQVVIAPNGAIKNTKVIGGHPLLIDAALDALKKWKYDTASDETTQIVEFKFNPSGNN